MVSIIPQDAPQTGTNIRCVNYISPEEYDTGKYLSMVIPLQNAKGKTLTLRDVRIAGQNTSYLANCSILASLTNELGFVITVNNSVLAGKLVYIYFDYA